MVGLLLGLAFLSPAASSGIRAGQSFSELRTVTLDGKHVRVLFKSLINDEYSRWRVVDLSRDRKLALMSEVAGDAFEHEKPLPDGHPRSPPKASHDGDWIRAGGKLGSGRPKVRIHGPEERGFLLRGLDLPQRLTGLRRANHARGGRAVCLGAERLVRDPAKVWARLHRSGRGRTPDNHRLGIRPRHLAPRRPDRVRRQW